MSTPPDALSRSQPGRPLSFLRSGIGIEFARQEELAARVPEDAAVNNVWLPLDPTRRSSRRRGYSYKTRETSGVRRMPVPNTIDTGCAIKCAGIHRLYGATALVRLRTTVCGCCGNHRKGLIVVVRKRRAIKGPTLRTAPGKALIKRILCVRVVPNGSFAAVTRHVSRRALKLPPMVSESTTAKAPPVHSVSDVAAWCHCKRRRVLPVVVLGGGPLPWAGVRAEHSAATVRSATTFILPSALIRLRRNAAVRMKLVPKSGEQQPAARIWQLEGDPASMRAKWHARRREWRWRRNGITRMIQTLKKA